MTETQLTFGEVTPEYQAFVDKFKPKLTTDDCYTPPLVYEAVADWAAKTYGLDKAAFVRPFWPGGDYEHFDYPEDCVVVDNPPFSILREIVEFYSKNSIRFLLFTQHTTGLKKYVFDCRCTVLAAGAQITYANGAIVSTGFVTNLEREYIIRTVPDLTASVAAANVRALAEIKKTQPVYTYPDNIVTSAMMGKYSKYGVNYGVRYGEAVRISSMDSQRSAGKSIFGSGLLLSEKAAAEKAAAEKADAFVWPLSDRERKMIQALNEAAKKG